MSENNYITREELRQLLQETINPRPPINREPDQTSRLRSLEKKLRLLLKRSRPEGTKQYRFHGAFIRFIKRFRGRRIIVERLITEEEYQDDRFWEWMIDKHGDDLYQLYRRKDYS